MGGPAEHNWGENHRPHASHFSPVTPADTRQPETPTAGSCPPPSSSPAPRGLPGMQIGAQQPVVAQMAENLSAMWETGARSLSWEDPLEEGMAAHSSTLAWRIPRTEESGGLQSVGPQRVRHN